MQIGSLPFELTLRTRLVYGPGEVKRVGELARDLGLTRVMLVSDPGLVKAGHVKRVIELLEGAEIAVVVFAETGENPSTADVAACLARSREQEVDGFLALGGGSAIDAAKGTNFLLTNGGEMKDYWGKGKATQPMLPLIAIPTTAGTGSEVQQFCLISDAETHAKMACGDVKATPTIAILDPELTLTLPPRVTALTGVDAITHALESAVCKVATMGSRLYAYEAFGLASGALPQVLARPDDCEARGQMLLAASLAGLSIENSMLGAAHAMANPLTAMYGIEHGLAVGMMMPYVIAFNSENPDVAAIYATLSEKAGLTPQTSGLRGWFESLLATAGYPSSLADLGVSVESIPELAAGAATQWTGTFNPRPVEITDFVEMYRSAHEGQTL